MKGYQKNEASLHLKKVYSNLFYVDGPTGSSKAASHIMGASPRVTGLNLDKWTGMVRNRGINPGWKLTQDPPVATQLEPGFEPATSRSLQQVD